MAENVSMILSEKLIKFIWSEPGRSGKMADTTYCMQIMSGALTPADEGYSNFTYVWYSDNLLRATKSHWPLIIDIIILSKKERESELSFSQFIYQTNTFLRRNSDCFMFSYIKTTDHNDVNNVGDMTMTMFLWDYHLIWYCSLKNSWSN